MSNDTLESIDKTVDKLLPTFNVSDAITLRLKHKYTYQMLANHYGMKKANVHKRLRRFMAILDQPDNGHSFENVRKNILSAVEMKLLEKMVDPETLKDASLNNAAYAYNVIFNANRLENDKSTSNVNFSALIQSITSKNKSPEHVKNTDVVNK